MANAIACNNRCNAIIITRIKRNENDIIKERFADAILTNRCRDLWAEVKRIRGGGSSLSNVVDGFSTPDDISAFFASKYQELYTSVHTILLTWTVY